MSKPTDSFWHGFGWCLVWLGLFGGISILVWSVNHYGNQDERLCIQEHGQWIDIGKYTAQYTCKFEVKK